MSFTPPTRPMMMQAAYGYPPMIPPPGMIPVRPPILPPGMPPLKSIVERGQATTVFVGNISERAPDAMMRQMLQKCGNVLNWKRATGAGGKLQTFGFCEYDNPDATLRCIRLLNGYEIADKKISVKVDQKTRDLLSDHIKKLCAMDPMRRRRQAPEDDNADINLEYVDENNLKEDRTVLNSFETIIRTYAKELSPPEPVVAQVEKPVAPKVDKPDEDKAKGGEKSPGERRRDRSPRHRPSSPRHERSRSGSLSRRDLERDLYKENRPEETEEQKERRRIERKLREKEMAYRERLDAWEAREQKKKYEYSVEKKKEAQRQKLAAKEAKKLRQFLEDYDDSKDDSVYYKGSAFEKKVKAREKEIDADNKDRCREREELDELKRKLDEKGVKDLDAEAKRIQNDESMRLVRMFDNVDESSSSSSDEEHEADETANGTAQLSDLNPNRVAEVESVQEKGEEEAQSTIEQATKEQEAESVVEPEKAEQVAVMTPEQMETSGQEENAETPDPLGSMDSPMKIDSPSDSNSPYFSGQSRQSINLTTAVKIRSVQREKSAVVVQKNNLFNEEEEEQTVAAKKARMVFNKSSEEKKRAVKKLVESIPADRDELFNFKIDWSQLDDSLMEKRIKPWINKKIIEYIGEEEESLNEFICAKIQSQTPPEQLLKEVHIVLEEETELFVKKMWRLLVYETEAKRLGIQSK